MNISRKTRKKEMCKNYINDGNDIKTTAKLLRIDFGRKRHRLFRTVCKQNKLPF
ncbi:MAG: hypothetical protein MJZ03_04530 [archaeon]|nr:hypothetical protein [archaeon]